MSPSTTRLVRTEFVNFFVGSSKADIYHRHFGTRRPFGCRVRCPRRRGENSAATCFQGSRRSPYVYHLLRCSSGYCRSRIRPIRNQCSTGTFLSDSQSSLVDDS